MTMVVTSIVVLCFLSIVLYQCIAAVERRMMGSSK